jgi:hypothetical protein
MFVNARSIRSALRLSAVLATAWGVTGCSTVDGWVDSVTGSSSEASTTPVSDDQNTAATDPAGGQTVAEASDQYPNIADQPDKAPPSSSADENKQVAEGLTADRGQAQYSGDALRGGTEAAAAPPAPAPPPPPPSAATEEASAADTAPAATAPAASATADTGADSDTADTSRDAGDLPTGKAPMPGALPTIQGGSSQVASAAPSVTPAAPPPAAVTTTPMPAPAPSASAPAPVPSYSYAAPPPPPPVQPVSHSDAALGFRPSHAPPLDASVSQFVAPAVLDRYQQTAAMSSAPGIAGAPRAHTKAVHRRVKRKKTAPAAAAAPADVPETPSNP